MRPANIAHTYIWVAWYQGPYEFFEIIIKEGFMKAIIAAGGTGGHIYPAIAIINKINLAYSLNIVNGYGDGTFRPDAPLTRAEACAILARSK